MPPWCWNWAHCNSTPAGSSTASTAAGVAAAVAGAVSSPDWRHTQRQAELRTGRQIMARTVTNGSLVWFTQTYTEARPSHVHDSLNADADADAFCGD